MCLSLIHLYLSKIIEVKSATEFITFSRMPQRLEFLLLNPSSVVEVGASQSKGKEVLVSSLPVGFLRRRCAEVQSLQIVT